jgi:hypothetical protein
MAMARVQNAQFSDLPLAAVHCGARAFHQGYPEQFPQTFPKLPLEFVCWNPLLEFNLQSYPIKSASKEIYNQLILTLLSISGLFS